MHVNALFMLRITTACVSFASGVQSISGLAISAPTAESGQFRKLLPSPFLAASRKSLRPAERRSRLLNLKPGWRN
jgi:hypothetical protein